MYQSNHFIKLFWNHPVYYFTMFFMWMKRKLTVKLFSKTQIITCISLENGANKRIGLLTFVINATGANAKPARIFALYSGRMDNKANSIVVPIEWPMYNRFFGCGAVLLYRLAFSIAVGNFKYWHMVYYGENKNYCLLFFILYE